MNAAASCQAFLLLGYDQGVMSGLIGANNEFGKQFGHPDATMQGIRMSLKTRGYGNTIHLANKELCSNLNL